MLTMSRDFSVLSSFLHDCIVLRFVSNHNGVTVELTFGPARIPTIDSWYNS
jgi:hypothetical protein